MIISDAEISIITDQGANTGIGRYALAVHSLLRRSFPNLKLVQLTHFSSAPIPSAEKPSFIKPASRLLSYPFQKHRNLKLIRSESLFSNSNVHICGSDYSLTAESTNTICTVHDYFFRFPSFESFKNPKELLSEVYINYYNLLTPRHIKRSGAIVVNSYSVQRDLLTKTGLNSKVVHIWTDNSFRPRDRIQSRRRLGLPIGKKLLLNVSGAGVNKNLPTLERLADILPTGFVIVKVGQPILHPRILNVSYVPSEDYPYYFNATDFYINTSIREGFCAPLIESISSGLPVISPKLAPFDEILGDAAAYVQDPMNEREFLAQVLSVSERPINEDLISRALNRKSNFSEDTARASLVEIYKRCFKL